MTSRLGIRAISYYVPPIERDVYQLAAAGCITTDADQLAGFGFSRCLIADRSASDVAIEVGAAVLREAGIASEEVGLLICAHAVSCSSVVPPDGLTNALDGESSPLGLFRFSAARVQHALGLQHSRVLGLSDLGCVSLINAVSLAHELLPNTGKRYALCINADVLPRRTSREILHSIISDAGCAVLIDTQADGYTILGSRHLTKGFYWDCEKTHNELLAAYFPTASRFIQRFLRDHNLELADISHILPNNVSMRSWEILSEIIGIDLQKVYTPNISRCGHSIAADNFINLRDAMQSRLIESGQKILLFGFGLGAHWSAMLIAV